MGTIVHGWPEDAERWLGSVRRHTAAHDFEALMVVNGGDPWPDPDSWPEGARGHSFEERVGWGKAANELIAQATGDVVVLFDPGTELTGDVAGPLLAALKDESVALAGAFGVRCEDHVGHFQESQGPEVDALEGYCLAFRREQALECGGFDAKFRFYRIADFDFSFRMRERYGTATIVPGLPLVKHEHRLWEALEPDERERLSKKNFFRFMDRWRGREDLLVER